MFHFRYLIIFLCGTLTSPFIVAARFCEGGHRCSPPKECCPQGCCYLYAPPSAPRSPPPATDHVLNLFFMNHWYFWCLVVAIILAILCACALWKKRRQLCGWGSNDRHTQSEGDSAGSCYAPPQYSRCSSFHHPPPPYTEVTSKPDLYPLVFTCNGDNGKTGASYLMVQYFRNYIVRPAGSLSATSTVDSLSSSFICTANEANTLVPPPYSRAASPDVGINSSFQQHFVIPRSASQLACSQPNADNPSQMRNTTVIGNENISGNQAQQNYSNNSHHQHHNNHHHQHHHNSLQQIHHPQMRTSESVNFQSIRLANGGERINTVIGSQSDQQFRYIESSNSNISDIFVNNNINNNNSNNNNINSSAVVNNTGTDTGTSNNPAQAQAQANHNIFYNRSNSTNQFNTATSNNPLYNSCGSIGGISITVPVAVDDDSEYRDLNVLRRSLETCCQILQQQQMPSVSFNSEDSPVNVDMVKSGIRSYVTSTTCSAVSSLANIGSPSSPPQATSPTGEVKELLEQIRQLHTDNRCLDAYETQQQQHMNANLATSSASIVSSVGGGSTTGVGGICGTVENNAITINSVCKSANANNLAHMSTASPTCTSMPPIAPPPSGLMMTTRRPSTLQSKKKFFSKPNKAMYIPINSSNIRSIRSPVGAATSFLGRGRGRRGWISRSAPTTPGTTLPPSRLGDDSPLLNEHDEDAEQNA